MDRESTLRRYLKERFKNYHDGIAAGDILEDVVDSMGLFELVDFIEQEFGISIPNEEFSPQRFESIESILQLIAEFDGN